MITSANGTQIGTIKYYPYGDGGDDSGTDPHDDSDSGFGYDTIQEALAEAERTGQDPAEVLGIPPE